MPSRVLGFVLAGVLAGCSAAEDPVDSKTQNTAPADIGGDSVPNPNNEPVVRPLPPAPASDKPIYANSFLNKPAPEFVVEQWLSPKIPDREGKMVLIDFWATWCPPCIASIPKLNQFHREHKDRLVVIGVSDQSAEDVKALERPRINYFLAIDPQMRMYNELGIEGIPHVIIVDPTGIVRWEGYPLEQGHELTETDIKHLLDTYVR